VPRAAVDFPRHARVAADVVDIEVVGLRRNYRFGVVWFACDEWAGGEDWGKRNGGMEAADFGFRISDFGFLAFEPFLIRNPQSAICNGSTSCSGVPQATTVPLRRRLRAEIDDPVGGF